jgi:ElaB/YqjD/DUF883 family membrane-anchored ribosome-binding protein
MGALTWLSHTKCLLHNPSAFLNPKDFAMNTTPLTNQTNSVLDQAAHVARQAEDLTQRGVDAVRAGGEQLREKAQTLSDGTVDYIKDEPIKSMLIAAATGAALMAMLSLVSRAGHRH